MRKPIVFFLLALALGALPARAATPAVPLVTGPDIPAVTTPTTLLVFDHERFDGCAGKVVATRTIDVPAGAWNRAILDFTGTPAGDPWDRMYSVSIGGAEVLRGTTPRTEFSIRRDITEYVSLLPSGGQAVVSVNFGTYVGAQLGTVTIELYQNEPTAALVAKPWDAVIPLVNLYGLNGSGKSVSAPLILPSWTPSSAVVDLTLSNHGSEEAQFLNRLFDVYLDGTDVATARAMPYTYAIAGLGGPGANTACGTLPGTSSTGDAVHPLVWWTAQRAADAAGVHTGIGEIPPYRATVDAAALVSRPTTVMVKQTNGGAVWITSLNLLLAK